MTHMTFLNATPDTLELIRMGEYTLIIDEELDVVEDFNRVQSVECAPRQGVTKEDVRMLLDNDIIRLEGNRVVWNGGQYSTECKFSEVQKFAKLNRLYLIADVFLIAVFPPEMFRCFDKIYILTYLFEGSVFKYYLDLFGIEYDFASVSIDEGHYSLTAYTDEFDKDFREKCKELIAICDNEKMIMYKRGNLSKSWYEKAVRDGSINTLKCNVSNFFRNQAHAKATDGGIMWTCPKEYKDRLSGKGYTCIRKLTAEEKKLSPSQKEDIEKSLSCFVPCNARATNIYRERWALAYCFNMYLNPMIRRFFTDSEIYPDEDLYSLSCMLQWILRSRLRDGKSIVIYIPSARMRELLQRWLGNDI